jgi:hypothetical protein
VSTIEMDPSFHYAKILETIVYKSGYGFYKTDVFIRLNRQNMTEINKNLHYNKVK